MLHEKKMAKLAVLVEVQSDLHDAPDNLLVPSVNGSIHSVARLAGVEPQALLREFEIANTSPSPLIKYLVAKNFNPTEFFQHHVPGLGIISILQYYAFEVRHNPQAKETLEALVYVTTKSDCLPALPAQSRITSDDIVYCPIHSVAQLAHVDPQNLTHNFEPPSSLIEFLVAKGFNPTEFLQHGVPSLGIISILDYYAFKRRTPNPYAKLALEQLIYITVKAIKGKPPYAKALPGTKRQDFSDIEHCNIALKAEGLTQENVLYWRKKKLEAIAHANQDEELVCWYCGTLVDGSGSCDQCEYPTDREMWSTREQEKYEQYYKAAREFKS